MNPHPTIDILLATYNSSAYLPIQIRSLQNQTHTDWRLLVHDDGSTDDTVAIVRSFVADDSRITFLEDGKTFHSAPANFLHLLNHSTAPFCIFCDADDIWLENKLEVLYEAISRRDVSRPQAVWCNSYIYESDTARISGFATLAALHKLRDILFSNAGIQGCAILFNKALRLRMLPAPSCVAMHDHLLCLAALTFGELTYIPMRLMLYRRHSNTVTGHTDSSMSERIRHFLRNGKPVLDATHYEAIHAFYEQHHADMSSEVQEVFRRFFLYAHRGRISNAIHALRDGFRLHGKCYFLCIKLLLRPLMGAEKRSKKILYIVEKVKTRVR